MGSSISPRIRVVCPVAVVTRLPSEFPNDNFNSFNLSTIAGPKKVRLDPESNKAIISSLNILTRINNKDGTSRQPKVLYENSRELTLTTLEEVIEDVGAGSPFVIGP